MSQPFKVFCADAKSREIVVLNTITVFSNAEDAPIELLGRSPLQQAGVAQEDTVPVAPGAITKL
jgi:hypothetical protein